MKKTFLFAALMAVATLVGCSSDDDNGTESGSSAISVTPTTLSVSGSGGNNEVTVIADGAWTAASDASWISLTTTSGSGNASVTLMVDANSDSSSRSGEVVFTSGSESAAVVVTQAAAGSSGSSFTVDITVENIEYTTMDIYFVPSDDTQEYVYGLFEKGLLESYYSSDDDIMAAIIDNYLAYDALDYYVLTGSVGGTLSGFTPSTSYTAYAFAINAAHTASASDLFSTDFTMVEAVVADEYNAWLGTWTMTSTSSELAGKSLSLEVIFTDDDGIAVPGLTYSVYGWDISGVRYILPLPADFEFDYGGFTVAGETEMYTDEDGYIYEYVGYAEVPNYAANYIITGSYDALIANINSDNQSATVYGGTGTLGDGYDSQFNVWNVIMLSTDGYNYYSFYNDESLGFEDYEVLFGPFTLTKISNDETVPATYAPQRVPGFDNIEGQAPVLKNVKASAAQPAIKPVMATFN